MPYVFIDKKSFDQLEFKKWPIKMVSPLTSSEHVALIFSSFVPAPNFHAIFSVLVRRRRRLNTPRSPCVEGEGYAVFECANRFIEERVGCSSPWTHHEVRIGFPNFVLCDHNHRCRVVAQQ